MIVYRLTKGKYHLDLSGKGAELYGGRWNSKGVPMLYTSESRALAFVEIAMHIPMGIVPKDYFLISIDIPDTASILRFTNADMPSDWRSNPHSNTTQQIGDQFVADNKFLILQVPSAVVPGDYNFLVNPNHSKSSNVQVISFEPFEFDSRFVKR